MGDITLLSFIFCNWLVCNIFSLVILHVRIGENEKRDKLCISESLALSQWEASLTLFERGDRPLKYIFLNQLHSLTSINPTYFNFQRTNTKSIEFQ